MRKETKVSINMGEYIFLGAHDDDSLVMSLHKPMCHSARVKRDALID